MANVLPRRGDERIEVQMQEVIYNSLDVVDERVLTLKTTPMRDNDGFLGCLAVVGPLSLYGFITNTHKKIIVALRNHSDKEHRDASVRIMLRKIHIAVVNALLNPFTPLDDSLRSAAFDARVDDIARRFS